MADFNWHLPELSDKATKRVERATVMRREGQTLWHLAQELYKGNFTLALILAGYNDIENPFEPPTFMELPR